MPYIPQEDRMWFQFISIAETPGELNYAFTKIIQQYLGEKPNYQKFNDVVGALENCKLELYRRRIGPYEEEAIKRNGDVE